jgi:hypothetical protein
MTGFRVIALPTQVAEQVRASLRAPGYGHPAHVEIASSYGPCRRTAPRKTSRVFPQASSSTSECVKTVRGLSSGMP